jgi:hypothetical protein
VVPLSFAVYKGNETLFNMLIDNGANPALVTSESMDLIAREHSWYEKGDESVVNKLVSSVYISVLV